MKLTLDIKMSKKQQWEYKQLDAKYRMQYLVSFLAYTGFDEAYTNLSTTIMNSHPLQKTRRDIKRSIYESCGYRTMEERKRELYYKRQILLQKLSTKQLKALIA